MMCGKTIGLTTGILLAAATSALAKDDGGGQAFFGMSILPAVVLLLALPLAVILRISIRPLARAVGVLEEKPFTCLLIGAANLVLVILVVAAAPHAPILAPVAGVLFLALLVVALVGLSAVAASIGIRLFEDERRGGSVGAFALAWLLLSGISLTPFLGFFVLLWFVAKGMGSVVLGAFRKE